MTQIMSGGGVVSISSVLNYLSSRWQLIIGWRLNETDGEPEKLRIPSLLPVSNKAVLCV